MLLFALWRIGVRVSRAAEAFAQSEAQGGE
jgi:hypothetical protein